MFNNLAMEFQIHEFQVSILRELLFKPKARFRDLNTINIANDHFTFHIKKLVSKGLVIKESGKYSLTTPGKEFANRLDTDSLLFEKQAKVAVALHAVRKRKGITEYLIHQRLKEPFYGWYGSHSGKIRWGEKPLDAAKREFFEETGLTGDFVHKGITHVIHKHKDGRLLEDKYFWSFLVKNTKGKLLKEVEEGKNMWVTEKEYRKIKNMFATFDEIEEVISSNRMVYVEREWVVDSY